MMWPWNMCHCLIPLVVFCRLEQSAGRPGYSIREDTTFGNIMTADKYNQDTPATQDKETPECKVPTGHLDNEDSLTKDVPSLHTGPEHLVCTKNMAREASPGELALGVASIQSQSPAEDHSSMVPHQGEQPPLQEEHCTSPGTSGGPKIDELPSNQMKSNETNNALNSSSQSRMILQGSTLIFSEEPACSRASRELVIPAPLRQPLHLTFDPSVASSHAFTETQEDRKAAGAGAAPSPWRSPSVPSVDRLPTFTSQRPPDLPTTMGEQAPSNSWNVSSNAPCEYRYVYGRFNHKMFEEKVTCELQIKVNQ